jgi:hypothetical protein
MQVSIKEVESLNYKRLSRPETFGPLVGTKLVSRYLVDIGNGYLVERRGETNFVYVLWLGENYQGIIKQ